MDVIKRTKREIPMEIIRKVMKCLLPADPNAIISHDDPAMKLLLAFSTVSRATHEEAVKLLKQHGLNFESQARTSRFVACLNRKLLFGSALPSVFEGIESIHLNISQPCFMSYTLLSHVAPTLRRLTIETDANTRAGFHLWKVPFAHIFPKMVNLEDLVGTMELFHLIVSLEEEHQGNSRFLPSLKRLALRSDWQVYQDQCIEWPLHKFPLIEHMVLFEACVFPRFSFPAELVKFREQNAVGPLKMVLVDQKPDHPHMSGVGVWYCDCKIDKLDVAGGDNVIITKHELVSEAYNVNTWSSAALAGELWGWGGKEPSLDLYREVTGEQDDPEWCGCPWLRHIH
ncbi:hypothetical protein F4821DRAFT_258518 [Hypoxylon rubiginosum]|uniref:Uncharacterized protein n=1 Tax=Hypoxylon rubiginosum TaxID=110542 RepID=A0ACC0D5Y7_9PEZI|nr:hypothetical protein F4821DRAFT_258518 [Hypoxylon rubiginosum]